MRRGRSPPPPAPRARSRGRRRCRGSWPSAGRSPAPAAVICRSIGNEVPASAAAPSGHSFIRARASAKRPRRGQHLDIGHQMVAEGHRLGRLQMGEARHQRVGDSTGLGHQRPLQLGDLADRARRWRRAPTGGSRAPPGRCASARCAAGRPPGRSARPAGSRRSCGCPRTRAEGEGPRLDFGLDRFSPAAMASASA